MTPTPIGSYSPGTSALHRAPAGLKLGFLFFGAIALAVFKGPVATLIALLIVLSLILISGVKIRSVAKLLRGFWILLAVLFVFHTWQTGLLHAFTIVGTLTAIITAASLLTMTTTHEALLDVLRTILKPLKMFGISPEKIAFAVALVLRTIPLLFEVARETRDAAKARGLERSPRALIVPLLIRSIKHALELGDALGARNLP